MVESLVSIIIPLYNTEHLICETLDAIRQQTYKNWECLIIDDGSTDKGYNVVNQYCLQDDRFQLFKRPEKYKSGGSGARNFGFDVSKGDFIQWFDADDIMHQNMLIEKIEAFLEDEQAVICKTVQFKDSIENTFGEPTNIESSNKFVDFFTGQITYYTPGPMWRKSFLEQNDLKFNEELLNIQEWEFYCKILLQDNLNFNYINKPLIYYRKHENSIWGKERSIAKIMSEFNGVKCIYQMSGRYKTEIVKVYFQRLCKLETELKKARSIEDGSSQIKKEILKTFLSMPFNIKSLIKFVKSYLF